MFLVLKNKSIIAAVGITVALTLLLAAVGASGAAGVFFGESTRKVPVYGVERAADEEKVIALTFDAAWGADKTRGIIEIMREYDAKGTFFLVGFWIDKYADEVKAIADAGFEIGNHSKNHLNMPRLSEQEILSEIRSVNEQIESITGITPKYFRAPFGDYNNRLMDAVEELNMVGVQWSIDSLDWKGLSAREITQRVVPKAKSGDIVLFHNNSDNILEALPEILKELKNQGFRFVGLGELVATDNFYVDANGIQHKK